MYFYIISFSTNSLAKTALGNAHSLEVIAAPLPEVEFDLPVEAENLADVRHLPQPGHHLQDALGCPVFLKSRYFET